MTVQLVCTRRPTLEDMKLTSANNMNVKLGTQPKCEWWAATASLQTLGGKNKSHLHLPVFALSPEFFIWGHGSAPAKTSKNSGGAIPSFSRNSSGHQPPITLLAIKLEA
ncbi:hypothetical protein evm_006542 [Chilo suppressalis]|nr:hypothetical protein evm_006542 [Chilo suppressalis]